MTLRLLAIAHDPRLASSRLRVVQLAEALRALGAAVAVHPYPQGPRVRAEWSALRGAAEEADVVLLQKRLPGLLDARRLRALGPPLVFDFDDALPFRQRPKLGRYKSSTRARRFARVLGLSSGVVAGNAYLAELARAALGSAQRALLVAPTAVPLSAPAHERAAPDAGKPLSPLSIGWIGGRGNLEALRALEAPLARLAARRSIELVVIADAPFETRACRVRHVPWTLETQEAELARLDVGVMPLADSPWNRGKCAYKLLQYMAAGVPAVASPVGMNAELVRDGENGRLAQGDDQWLAALERLAERPDERGALGAAGRRTVEEAYTFPRVAARVLAFLAEVVRAAPRAQGSMR